MNHKLSQQAEAMKIPFFFHLCNHCANFFFSSSLINRAKFARGAFWHDAVGKCLRNCGLILCLVLLYFLCSISTVFILQPQRKKDFGKKKLKFFYSPARKGGICTMRISSVVQINGVKKPDFQQFSDFTFSLFFSFARSQMRNIPRCLFFSIFSAKFHRLRMKGWERNAFDYHRPDCN